MHNRIGVIVITGYTCQMPISDVIREAIKGSGKTLNEIARETGIPQPTISRFVLGADLRVSNVDKLAEYFGLKLSGKSTKTRRS